MAKFDPSGNYEFRYFDKMGSRFTSAVRAEDDAKAMTFATQSQFGWALEVWRGERLVGRLSSAPARTAPLSQMARSVNLSHIPEAGTA